MSDPYKVLGISPDCSDEEVKKAYHELARKYHPDNYAGNPLADLVSEKMKEINEAYEQVQKERAGGSRPSSRASAEENGQTAFYSRVRAYINSGRFDMAERMLDSVPSTERGAEWNYLRGCICLQRGWVLDAQNFFTSACYMDPENSEYKQALDAIREQGSAASRGSSRESGCSFCDICNGLICADCCCESMGSDLLPCC